MLIFFHPLKQNLYPLNNNSQFSAPPTSGNLFLLSNSINLPILGTSDKGNYTTFALLCLALLLSIILRCIVFKVISRHLSPTCPRRHLIRADRSSKCEKMNITEPWTNFHWRSWRSHSNMATIDPYHWNCLQRERISSQWSCWYILMSSSSLTSE